MIDDKIIRLRHAQGINAKKSILRGIKTEPLIKFFMYVYDPYKSYGISGDRTNMDDFEHIPDEFFYEQLDKLVSREVTGHAAEKCISILRSTYGSYVDLVLCRTLDAGITAKTINAVYGKGTIPAFDIMKGQDDVKRIDYPTMASIKFDGVRIVSVVHLNHVKFYTSKGREFRIPTIERELLDLYVPGTTLDGELVYKTGLQQHRQVISGKLTSILAGGIDDIPEAEYHIFDMMWHNEWETQECPSDYQSRYANIVQGIKTHRVTQWVLMSKTEVDEMFDILTSKGFEGVMCRPAWGLYEWKRTYNLIKLKLENECILKVIDTLEGTGKYEGQVGALICEGYIDEVHVEVSVGSGLSDQDRLRKDFIGKNIEVMYNTVTHSIDKPCSLFLPRYKRVVGEL